MSMRCHKDMRCRKDMRCHKDTWKVCVLEKRENNESGHVYFWRFHMLLLMQVSISHQIGTYILMIIEFPEKDEELKENIDGALDVILR